MLPTSLPPSSNATVALESMTSIALGSLFPEDVGDRAGALQRPPTLGAQHDLLQRWLARDRRRLAEDQLGHRYSLARGADFQRLVELVRDVADLDHFHGAHMI